MRAISLRTLFLLVACVAFAVVVLVRPSLFWARVSFSAAVVFLGWMLVLAIVGQGERRRFGIGAAMFGIGYFYLALCGSASNSQFSNRDYVFGRTLVTHQLLESISPWLGHKNFPTGNWDFQLWDSQLFSEFNPVVTPAPSAAGMGGSGAGAIDTTGDASPATPGTFYSGSPFSSTLTSDGTGMGGGFGGAGQVFAVQGRAIATAHGQYQQYLISGHCLFVILIGWLAGALAGKVLCPRSADEEVETNRA